MFESSCACHTVILMHNDKLYGPRQGDCNEKQTCLYDNSFSFYCKSFYNNSYVFLKLGWKIHLCLRLLKILFGLDLEKTKQKKSFGKRKLTELLVCQEKGRNWS